MPIYKITFEGLYFSKRGGYYHDLTIRDLNRSEESPESKELSKRGYDLNRKILAWTIIGVLAAVPSVLIALHII